MTTWRGLTVLLASTAFGAVTTAAAEVDEASGLIKSPGWEAGPYPLRRLPFAQARYRPARGSPDLAGHDPLDASDAESLAIRRADGSRNLGLLSGELSAAAQPAARADTPDLAAATAAQRRRSRQLACAFRDASGSRG